LELVPPPDIALDEVGIKAHFFPTPLLAQGWLILVGTPAVCVIVLDVSFSIGLSKSSSQDTDDK
jgi:hypothetical protein